MGTDLKSFCTYLDELLKLSEFQDTAINGLQVEGKEAITTLGTAVTASLQVIKQAVESKVDVLLVHHGLFVKNHEYVVVGTLREKLKLLLEHNISLVATHLPLDAHENVGNNWAIAKQLGWKKLEPFGEYLGNEIGVKGSFPAMTRQALQEKLEDVYEHPASVAFGGKEHVSSCALVSGGGYKLIYQAAKAGVDCFVTGNFDEPAWHAAFEEKINFMAFGHAATEKVGVQKLGEALQKEFKLRYQFIDEPNPF